MIRTSIRRWRLLAALLLATPLTAALVCPGRSAVAQTTLEWLTTEIMIAGLTPDESLRRTAFNPDPEAKMAIQYVIFLPDGTPVRDTGPQAVDPLQTVFFDVNGDDRALDDFREPTGRVQLAAIAIPSLLKSRHSSNEHLVIGAELVDAATGKTTAAVPMKEVNRRRGASR